jgi:Carbamoyltransferase C-terminus
MLQEFERRTGYAVLINTSFNLRGEPIVCSPEDAYRCLVGIGDYLRRHCLLAVAARSPSGSGAQSISGDAFATRCILLDPENASERGEWKISPTIFHPNASGQRGLAAAIAAANSDVFR